MLQCFTYNEEYIEPKSHTSYKKLQDIIGPEKETMPTPNGKIIRIIDKYYIELLYVYSLFGFIKEHIIYLVTSSSTKLTILDLDSNKTLYQNDMNINIRWIYPLSGTLIFILSNSAKQIILFDYKDKKCTKKSFPKEFDFLSCQKIDDNTFLMTNKETIYVYTLNCHNFSYFKYKEKFEQKGIFENQNIYIINKEIILIWTFRRCVETVNIETQKLVSNKIFQDTDKFGFVDTRNGIIYNEKELSYIDKTYIKVLIFNYQFNHCELFDYSFYDILKRIYQNYNKCYFFSIPNSSCICYSNSKDVQFYDYILKEKIGYYPTLFSPSRLKVSSKYILTEYGGYKIYRNRL